jgi:formylmethanofuran dehydrogenase subunit E-like metal-binding protein
MARKTSTSQCRVVEVQNPEWIIAYLEYVRDDLRMLSPMGAHLLDMAIKQVIEDTNSSESLEDQDAV